MRTFAQKQNQPHVLESSSLVRSTTMPYVPSHHTNPILRAQRTNGSQAVQRSLQTNAKELEAGSATTASNRFTHDFSRVPLHPKAHTRIQSKPTLSTPGDIYEQGADRGAHQFMRMPEPRREIPNSALSSLQAPVAAGSSNTHGSFHTWTMAERYPLRVDVRRGPRILNGVDSGHAPMFPPRNTAIKAEAKPGGGPEKLSNVAAEPALPGESPVLEAAPGPVTGAAAPPATPPAVPMDGGAACTPPPGTAWTAGQHLAPAFSVTETESRSNTDSATTSVDTPTFTGDPAIDSAACLWRYQLKSVKGDGRIALVFYTQDHYPAPTPNDDSGDLSNVTQANWNSIVTDLDTHKTGVAGNWSAYRRTILHERYHWATEWQGSVKAELVKAEDDIEKLSVGFTAAPNAGAAKTVLEPQAKGIFAAAMAKARRVYNALGDSAGDPPYVAGSAGAVSLIARIKAHATAKGW